MKFQKTKSIKNNPDQNEYGRRYRHSWFQCVLQSHKNKNDKVQVQKRYMSQYNRIKDSHIQIYLPDFWQKAQKYTWSLEDSIFNNGAGGSVYQCPTNKTRLISFTLSKTQLRDLSIKPKFLKLLEEKVGNSLQHTGTGNGFPILLH